MKFSEVVAQTLAWLQREGRVSYRALKREFDLDDEFLEDVKAEIIEAKRLAVDENGKVLVWTGEETQKETENRGNGEAEKESLGFSVQRLESEAVSAERRQLTVLFCDVVGSTTLSERLDPEELREVVRAYQQTSAAVIERYEGHIAQYLGDGLLVYFGYPAAREDDARRAVQAGLEIVGAIHELPLQNTRLQQPLQVRIGIHTGQVVVGEMGGGKKREQLALGDTPNIAARVQGHAEPDCVVMSAVTYRLVQGLFECHNLGPQALKGLSTPLSLYRVVGESAAQSRFEVAVRTGLTPLVGRESELGFLRAHWEQAKAGEGQVVLLSGEPGIGKSRFVQVLKEQAEQERATRIEFRCSPYHQNSAFHPIIEHLQRLLRFTPHDTPQTKVAKLSQRLASYHFPQPDTLPLVAALLSLPHPAGVPPLMLSPQKQKQKTQEALVAWVVEETEQAAVFCAWEDLQWVDPSSLEVLTLVLEQVPTVRLLAVLTFRPEFTPPWRPRAHLTQLTLNRLGRQHVEAMVEKVIGSKALPGEVVHQIVAKTDGVPLFVEELTKMVIESVESIGSVESRDRASLQSIAIPATLQDSLMARLDRLGPTKAVAQLGATLGREFSYEVLQAVSPVDEAALEQGLRQLVEAELLYQRGLPPQARYLFKHALIQDAAYQSLLKSTRQQYHRQIAQVLEERFPESKETQPELLAHHYTEGGLVEQAIPHWQRVGERAIERSANIEAVSHLTKGLEVLQTLPDTPARIQQELALQVPLGSSLMATKGYAAPEVARVQVRLRELCQQAGATPQTFRALPQLRGFHHVRAELQTARELAEQHLALAQRVQNPDLLLWAYYGLGETLYHLGELVPARAHLEQGVALNDAQQVRSVFVRAVQNPRVACLSQTARVLWYLGYPDQAQNRMQEALMLAQELAHPFSLAWALCLTVHQPRLEAQATQERAEAAIALATEQGFPYFLALGTTLRGWALAAQGQEAEGIAQIRQGLVAYRATGTELWRPYLLALLAEAYEKAGQVEDGLSVLAEALAQVNRTGERVHEAELYRLKGELLLNAEHGMRNVECRIQHPTPDTLEEAERCFWQAIEIARKQQAKSLELRAATSLARLWQQQGKTKEAHELLSAVYGWFTEGFDTADLKEAKVLLEELERERQSEKHRAC